MQKTKVSVIAAAARVRQEGIGYAVQHCICSDDIADPALATLWDHAAAALNDLETFFTQKLGSDWQTTAYHLHAYLEDESCNK